MAERFLRRILRCSKNGLIISFLIGLVFFLAFISNHGTVNKTAKETHSTNQDTNIEPIIFKRKPIETEKDFDLEEFYKADLVTQNHLVGKLSPTLTTRTEVIEEAQRIQLNMFKTLIGKYKYAMLFNIAGFSNIGDPTIGVGEVTLLRRLNIELVFHLEDVKNSEMACDFARKLSRKYTNETLVILLQGGGNLMSYAHQDRYRERVISRFMDFEVIMFPQSFWIFTPRQHQEHFKRVYNSHPKFTMLYRDEYSLGEGKKWFPNTRALLMPDIAFQLGQVDRFMPPVHNILWLRRTDDETLNYQIPSSARYHDVLVVDWKDMVTQKDRRCLESGFLIAADGMLFLLRGRVVITDRLHGHIISTLVGVPHVVLDNRNHKLFHYRDTWTAGLENVVVATTAEDALKKAVELLNKLDNTLPKVVSYRKSLEYDIGMMDIK